MAGYPDNTASVADLSIRIHEAFSSTVAPGVGSVFLPDVPGDERLAFADATVADASWQGLSSSMERGDWSADLCDSFVYMTYDGFCYYSPALVLFSMNPAADHHAYTFYWHVTPRPDDASYYAQTVDSGLRLRCYTEEQLRAIARVVDYLYLQDVADEMFANFHDFWSRWL